jgi:Holliday junction resolvase RusA-like endonuclease
MNETFNSEGLSSLQLVIPLIPPSVNHYKTPFLDRRGRTRYAVKKEFIAFKWAVAAIVHGRVMRDAKCYRVSVLIFLGKGQRGDAANFEKGIGDGLQDARVFKNDSRIKRYHIEVSRDWSNPRTEILVEVYEQPAIPTLGAEEVEMSPLPARVRQHASSQQSHAIRPPRPTGMARMETQSRWREHAAAQLKCR